jgi:hypothetical protein
MSRGPSIACSRRLCGRQRSKIFIQATGRL